MNATTGSQQSEKVTRKAKGPARKPGPDTSVRIGGVVIGMLAGRSEKGDWLVDHAFTQAGSQRARQATAETLEEGMAVALMFEGGDPAKPLILGPIIGAPAVRTETPRILELEAKQGIVLRCGDSSITLTESGKVILRGKYLLSRSSGVNRIKGASVQIN